MADAADFCAGFNGSPYYQLLGLRATSEAPGTSRVHLPFDAKLTQLYGGVHGGALMTLADSAISIAIFSLLEEGESIVTTELSMQFIAPAGTDGLVAEGQVSRRGRRLAFGRCELFAGERLVAQAQGMWAIRHPAD